MKTHQTVGYELSLRLGLNRFQEAMIIVLMIVFIFALNSNIELPYKISIAVMVFILMLLSSFAAQALKQGTQQKQG
ncbi:TPA: hypothetical protein HA273_02985 [Candidatus Bathyarchaeota archaeon]|nr:hypothetical protein [Candidatus Bathyarchaeota archaeon]